jgi:hypothetical protein
MERERERERKRERERYTRVCVHSPGITCKYTVYIYMQIFPIVEYSG